MLHPIIKAGFELPFRKQLFTGADVPAGKEVPVNKATAAVLNAIGRGHLIHQIHDPRTDKMVPGVDWKVMNVLQSFAGPLGGPALRAGTVGKLDLPENNKLRVAGLVAPQPRAIDPRNTRIGQLYEEQDRLKEEHKHAVQRYPGKHKSGDPWPKKSLPARINQRQAEITAEIEALTARIQGQPKPKGKGGRPKKHAALGGGLGGGGKFGGRGLGGGFGG
jgi:hypothetical protein